MCSVAEGAATNKVMCALLKRTNTFSNRTANASLWYSLRPLMTNLLHTRSITKSHGTHRNGSANQKQSIDPSSMIVRQVIGKIEMLAGDDIFVKICHCHSSMRYF